MLALKRTSYTNPNYSYKCLTQRQVVLNVAVELVLKGLKNGSANKTGVQAAYQASSGQTLVQEQEMVL